MIASRAGLAVLAAIAIVLAVIVVLEPRRGPVDHALVPGLDPATVTDLVVNGAHLVRDDHGWRWDQPPGRADAAAVDAILATLRGARWHRSAPRETARTIDGTVVVGGVTLGVGASLRGSDQMWIARDHDAVLVDAWVASALATSPVALRDQHPLAHPPALAPGYLVDPAFVRARADAYAALAPVAVPPCPNTAAAVAASTGEACVDPKLLAAARAFDTEPPPLDRRPLPAAPARVELPGGAILDRAHGAHIDGHNADPERVAELVAALTAPAEVVAVPPGAPTATITADTITLELLPGHILHRRGEARALAPTTAAWDVLTRPASALRDEARWLEDPATISALSLDGKVFHRGATLGDWPGAPDPALLEALATALATLRAPAGPAPAAIEHRVELTVTPPAGAPTTHQLELGAHCAARADGEPVALPLAMCTAVTAALAR